MLCHRVRLEDGLSFQCTKTVHVCDELWAELQQRWAILPSKVEASICAPSNCTEGEVRGEVFEIYLHFLMQIDRLPGRMPPPTPAELGLVELSHWSRVRLDFVVGGLNCCGTTSLWSSLAEHPDIRFSMEGRNKEDHGLQGSRVLPYRSEVEGLEGRWAPPGRRQPRIRAMANPDAWRAQGRLRQIFKRMGQVRVAVVLCDPVSRLEKLFWLFHHCQPRARLREVGPDRVRRCWSSMAAVLEEPELLELWRVGEDLRSLQDLLGDRLLVLHQEALRGSERQVFDEITAFLGLRPFPEAARFPRYNSIRGERSGLCRNESLLRELKAALEPEYLAHEEALLRARRPVPDALRLRRTRCDRSEELSEALPPGVPPQVCDRFTGCSPAQARYAWRNPGAG